MTLKIRHLAISAAGIALLVHGLAFSGGGIYIGPNGQRVTGEMVGNRMILISGNGARTPAPDGMYSCATGQHCPGGQQVRVNGGIAGVVVQGGMSPRDPAVKMGVQGNVPAVQSNVPAVQSNAPAGQLAPPPPGSAYKDRSAVKSEIRESAIKGEAYKERSAIKGEVKGENQIGGGHGIAGEKAQVGGTQMGTMPEMKSPATQGSR